MRASFLPLLWVFAASGAQAATSVSQALTQQDWDASLLMAQQMTGPELESQALPYAQRDVIPAMWLMGQARFLQRDLPGAARWFYRGWLGLQMDLSLCKQARSRNVVPVLMNSFPQALGQVRNDLPSRSSGIQDAARYYAGRLDAPATSGWSCTWAQQRDRIPARGQAPLTIEANRHVAARTRAFKTFLHATGLGPITASQPDPIDPNLTLSP